MMILCKPGFGYFILIYIIYNIIDVENKKNVVIMQHQRNLLYMQGSLNTCSLAFDFNITVPCMK